MIERNDLAKVQRKIIINKYLIFWLVVGVTIFFSTDKTYSGGKSVLPTLSQYTSLMRAAHEGDFSYLKELISTGDDINEQGGNNATALMAATAGNNLEIVKYLLKNGANPHKKTTDNLNVVTLAACGNIHILNEYLNLGVDTNLEYRSSPFFRGPALVEAVGCNNIKNVEALLKKGKNTQNSIMKAISVAGANSYIKILSVLLQHKGLRINDLAKNDGLIEHLFKDPNIDLDKISTQEKKILSDLSYFEVKAVKNAIFARNGYIFDSLWLDKYFSDNFKEYKPITKKILLSDLDKKNLKKLIKLEKNAKK